MDACGAHVADKLGRMSLGENDSGHHFGSSKWPDDARLEVYIPCTGVLKPSSAKRPLHSAIVERPSIARHRSSHKEFASEQTSSWCAWASDFDSDGDGNDYPSTVGLPSLSVTEGMASTCQSGSKRTERTNKPSADVASRTDLRTAMCARFFKTANRARAKHKPLNKRPTKRAPPPPQSICRTTPQS